MGTTKGPRIGFADGKGFESNRTPNWAKTYSRQAGFLGSVLQHIVF